MNPTMAAIMGVFQIVWVCYGLDCVATSDRQEPGRDAINSLSVRAYVRFARLERNQAKGWRCTPGMVSRHQYTLSSKIGSAKVMRSGTI